MDIQGPFESAPQDFRYLINLTDYYSKWPESCATSTITTKKITDFLVSRFAIWGLLDSMTTDNGCQFISAEFEEFLAKRGIQDIRTPNYHPAANGAMERLNGTIKSLIQANHKDLNSWFGALHSALEAIRSTPHSATNCSPHYLMTSREMPSKLTKLKPVAPPDHPEVVERMRERQEKMKQVYDAKYGVKDHSIRPGDKVRVKLGHPTGDKLRSHFSEPLIVTAVEGNILTLSDGKKWHANRLSKFTGIVAQHPPIPHAQLAVTAPQPPKSMPVENQVPQTRQRLSRTIKPTQSKDFVYD